mmetsp:Transcript_22538/g.20466  ORF Transcript_22538/g.20466 Transcript_22538/m.20466 type:complete len:235 (-) Transcript_22538:110-814(-)
MDVILSIAPPIFFLTMLGGSFFTANEIYNNKSTGELSPLPFGSLLTNCFIWTLYGLLVYDFTIFLPNLIGLFVSIVCLYIYQLFKDQSISLTYIYLTIAAISLIAVALYLTRNDFLLGLLGCLLAVLMFASPLATIKEVIANKSTESIPFSISVTGWLNSLSWSLFGIIVVNDPMVYVPNCLGFILSSIQLTMFIVYGFKEITTLDKETSFLLKFNDQLEANDNGDKETNDITN